MRGESSGTHPYSTHSSPLQSNMGEQGPSSITGDNIEASLIEVYPSLS